jgi:hypothetical protein
MAYVRTRTTKAGSVSTALVEAYRDEQGCPRQRLLANLHGQPDTLKALAMLAGQREALRKERERLAADAVYADQFYEGITQNALQGRQYSDTERKEIDGWLRKRERLLKRLAKVDGALAAIARDGVVIKKHCTATSDEIQAAIRAYKEELQNAEALALGAGLSRIMMGREAKAKLRRLSPWAEQTTDKDILGLAAHAGLETE